MPLVNSFLNVAHATGAHHLAKPLFGGFGCILMLHRIVPQTVEQDFSPNIDIEISAGYLEEVVNYFCSNEWDIIDLDELTSRLQQKQVQKPFVCFTFDDGYRDNLELALPIFEKFQAPFAVYATSGFIHRTHIPWWYVIEAALRENGRLSLTCKNQTTVLEATTSQQSQQAFIHARDILINATTMLQHSLVDELLNQISDKSHRDLDEMLLGPMELVQLSNSELVTIGAHSQSHGSLAGLDESSALQELTSSKTELEKMIDHPVMHFCYPFGGAKECGAREFSLAKQAGFSSATTTEKRNLMTRDLDRLFALPRIAVKGSQQQLKFLRTHLSGFAPLLYKYLPS